MRRESSNPSSRLRRRLRLLRLPRRLRLLHLLRRLRWLRLLYLLRLLCLLRARGGMPSGPGDWRVLRPSVR